MDGTSMAAHVFFGTLAFGIGITLDFVLVAVARTGRPETIRIVYEAVAKYTRFTGPLFLVTILLGVFIAIRRHESLISTWLLATYVLIVSGIAFNGAVVQRRTNSILRAVRGSTGSSTEELDRMIGAARPIGGWMLLIIMAAVIALMILKPV